MRGSERGLQFVPRLAYSAPRLHVICSNLEDSKLREQSPERRAAIERRFQAKVHILPAAQRRLWDELAAVPIEFVLYGGAALGLHLGHRESIGFDFFGRGPFNPAVLAAQLPFLIGAQIVQQASDTLSAIVDRDGPVQVSFFGVPGIQRLRPPHIAFDNGLRIATLLDLAGTKAAVVQQRAEAKDYQDLDAIFQDGRIDLPTALASARAIYGPGFNPQITLKALSFFGDGNLSRLPSAVQERLIRAVRDVDLDQLPEIAAQPGPAEPGSTQ